MANWEYYNLSKQKEKTYLMRFLSSKWLFDFLKKGSIWFPRADKFGDKLECISSKDIKEENLDYDKIELRKRGHLISCWHFAGNESVSMWDSYASVPEDRRKYALRFRSKQLIDYITNGNFSTEFNSVYPKFIYGPVRYKNMLREKPSIAKSDLIKYAAFRKEFSFEYESEFRFVVRSRTAFLDEGISLIIGEPSKLHFDILINPLLENSEYEDALKNILKSDFRHKFKESNLAKWFKPKFSSKSKVYN